MSGTRVELRSLRKRLGGREVLSGLTLEVEPGGWLALLGPSGSGKTTLLRLIAGFEAPDSGEVLLDGRPTAGVAPRDRGVGMVFQDLALWPHLTVEDHVREVAGSDPAGLLSRLGLSGHERKRPPELSGGERQRLALARALARAPRLLLLDEPFTGLDPLLRRSLAETLDELRREREFTTIYVSHHLEAPVAGAPSVALLRDGRIEQSGTLAELRAAPANDWVSQFLSSDPEVHAG